jgi:SpoIIAA-like
MIERLWNFPSEVIAVRCSGRVSKLEYDTIVVPAVATARKAHARLRLYYETGLGFSVEPAPVWEACKLGVEHLSHWTRVAVVTDHEWVRHTLRIFGYLMPGDLTIFPPSDVAAACAWIGEGLAVDGG